MSAFDPSATNTRRNQTRPLPTPDRWASSSQPSGAPEPPEQRRAGNQDHADDGEITIFPLQFRMFLKFMP